MTEPDHDPRRAWLRRRRGPLRAAGRDARSGLASADRPQRRPFARLRIVHLLSRLPRNTTLQLRDVLAWLNASFLDWSFNEKVLLATLVQLQANWSISFHGDDRIVLDRNERGHTC